MRPRTAKFGSEADLAFALHFTEGFLLDDSIISQETIAAYEATHFRVLGEPTFVLKIGQPSAPLRQLYKEYGCTSATFITAWNPRSVRTSDANNTAAQTQLERDLTERSIPFIAGIGKDPAGQWPGEMRQWPSASVSSRTQSCGPRLMPTLNSCCSAERCHGLNGR